MRPPSLHASAKRTMWGSPGLISALHSVSWQSVQLGGEEFRHIRIGDCVLCRQYVLGYDPFRIIVRGKEGQEFLIDGWCYFSVHRQLKLGPVAAYPVLIFEKELLLKERRGTVSYDIIVWWLDGLDDGFVQSSLALNAKGVRRDKGK